MESLFWSGRFGRDKYPGPFENLTMTAGIVTVQTTTLSRSCKICWLDPTCALDCDLSPYLCSNGSVPDSNTKNMVAAKV
jgi:hypothetical protein